MQKMLQGGMLILMGFLVMAGMRLAEYTFERPAMKLLVCVADSNGVVGHCDDFENFVKKN